MTDIANFGQIDFNVEGNLRIVESANEGIYAGERKGTVTFSLKSFKVHRKHITRI